jgi:hypothetical protein
MIVPQISRVDAPSNNISNYCVTLTTSSDLGVINHRILITRVTLGKVDVFEMLLTNEQFRVWRDIWIP